MVAELYGKIEHIINVSSMTNKWMMWGEKNLPEENVFVPSVFQMRDAYSHIISMLSTGIVEQNLQDDENAASKFDIQQFLSSDNVSSQLSEALSHTLRAFFDTAEYIAMKLSEEATQRPESFLLLRNVLTDLDETINQLRAEKANVPDKAYAIAEQWDRVLQRLTCAYAFSSSEQTLAEKYRSVFDLMLSIEQKFEREIIIEFDPQFFTKKASLPKLKCLPVEYHEFTAGGPADILEDPGVWQSAVKEEVNKSVKELDELYAQCERLMETMPSTALIRQGSEHTKTGMELLKNGVVALLSLLLTGVIDNCLFTASSVAGTATLNVEFLIRLFFVFAVVYILLSVFLVLLKKVFLWRAKRSR